MHKFSRQVEDYLVKSGWSEGRNIDIHLYVKDIEKDEYVLSRPIESFLKEFGGLTISFLRRTGQKDILHFNCSKAIAEIYSTKVKGNYSSRLNVSNLCVIGQTFTNHLTLMMDESGKVFGGYDDNLYKIADSGEEAIEIICSNKELIEIS